jgi:hypothetical protein
MPNYSGIGEEALNDKPLWVWQVALLHHGSDPVGINIALTAASNPVTRAINAYH